MVALNRTKEELWDRIVDYGLFHATDLIAQIPEKALMRLVEPRLRKGLTWEEGADYTLHIIKVLHRNWSRLHPNVRKKFAQNLFGNMMLRWGDRRRKLAERLGDYPSIMVVSPTMRCNLQCIGCYSANYDRQDAISTERLDRLYTEAEELGIGFIVVSGGEPYLRHDTLELFERHPNLLFMTYTNGTIIADKHLAPRLAELGNVIPCVSVEGFEKETDARRGRGVHKKIRRAMQEMRDEGVLFGFSATPMRHNNELLVSDEFIEYYMNLGARVGWYFNYVPIGRDPDLNLMPTPAQRLHRFHRIRTIREHYDLIVADFWTDGPAVGGCLSGGRTYFHINASGGVEPCVFNQFSVDNIKDKPLIECLDSDYFRHIRTRLRDVENPLRPCPVIDNPHMLREFVEKFHPTPSQPGGDALLHGEIAKGLDKYAKELKEIFDPVFEQMRDRVLWPTDPMGTIEEKRAWVARQRQLRQSQKAMKNRKLQAS